MQSFRQTPLGPVRMQSFRQTPLKWADASNTIQHFVVDLSSQLQNEVKTKAQTNMANLSWIHSNSFGFADSFTKKTMVVSAQV